MKESNRYFPPSPGALEKYCELMVGLQRWDRALALAPAVSLAYWRGLTQRYANQLINDENDNCIPYILATGILSTFYTWFLSIDFFLPKSTQTTHWIIRSLFPPTR